MKKLLIFVTSIFIVLNFLPLKGDATILPLSGKVFVIDPGHGFPDGGAKSSSGISEANINLQIAFYLRDFLQEAGALVYLTREKDKDLAKEKTKGLSRRKAEDLRKRGKFIEEIKPDFTFMIHLNSIPESRWRGAQVFYYPWLNENKVMAETIQKEFINILQNTNRVAKMKNDIYLIKQVKTPLVLIEAGFLSNQEEAYLLNNEDYQKKIAYAIYIAINRFYTENAN